MIIHAFAMTMTLAVCSIAEKRCQELSLPDRWRLLGGMIAIAGVLAFAWSTAVLLALAQRFQYEQLKRMSIDAPVDPQ
jgi:hypothetical protein